MNFRDPHLDVEDPFLHTRMPLGEHLEELRRRLWCAILGFGAIVALCFALDFLGYLTGLPIGVGKPAVGLLTRPVELELTDFYDRRVQRLLKEMHATPGTIADDEPKEVVIDLPLSELAHQLAPLLGLKWVDIPVDQRGCFTARIRALDWALALAKAQRLVGRPPTLAALAVTEAMMVYVQVTLFCGFLLASPWVFWQLWAFVAAGLHAHEKRYVHFCLPCSVGLFLTGVLFCQLLVLPKAVEALLWFNEWLNFEPDLRLQEWLGFALLTSLIFGLSFQTPLVIFFLDRVGIIEAESLRGQRRLAWFLLAVFAAVATPSVDALCMVLLWLSLGLLYEAGIWLCRLRRRREKASTWGNETAQV